MPKLDVAALRKCFPIFQRQLYINSCSQGALGNEVRQAYEQYLCDWDERGAPFGLLWVLVDQAEMLLKTHGRDASEAMLAIVERTLSHALRPGEILGRWGHHEFLVICHERSADLLLLHARHLCELTHSADFRWWGDRVPLTVSVGCAQAVREEKLKTLMQRAQQGMERARLGGGNTVVLSEAETMPAATEDTAGSRKTFKQDGR